MNSNIVANEDDDFSGPYRATKIWNTIIRAFKHGMPIGRRRRYMKVYDKAFTATEALEWMHKYLKSNPNFGSDITKQQTVQLMGKLLKARIFEDVQGSKKKREFAEGGRVYRFNQSSPAKDSRVPLSARMDLMNAAPGQKTVISKSEKSKTTSKFKSLAIPKCHLVAKPLSLESMEAVWRMVTLHRLQKTIGYNTLEEFLDASLVNGRHIMHNCLYVNKSGVVGNVNTKDQLPHWILSAMKCLVHWPNKVDDNFAIYPGFEKDVFRAVSEYFQGLTEPLLTHSLYETITNVFAAVWSMTDEERVKQAVQLALLLIPPSNRRKLHLLLRFLSKIHNNNELQLAQNSEDLRNLTVDTFYQSVLCSPDASDMDTNLAKHFLWYLVENHDFVMQVPCDLRKQVEERLSEIQRVQVVYSSDDKGSTTYCRQIPLSAYEKESLQHSTEALRDLLKKIVADEKMNFKEKRKRLSEFQKLYPKIYENELGFRNPIPAAPPLKIQRNIHLPRPLRRLRTLRS
ncbi:DEP domain-containing protein 1A isoform X4 [Octopus sinensis]|uniref:DEP domain-containing protein 1A isoform X4 n=1 Tax=Octopus sinensis TaxID=2607531 RepID=A0A6P7SP75_9MOLL|nr:DEP domain-containing protein 1A isoform X4 [Octopus sinensis]